MVPEFLPLNSARIERALALMERLYRHEAIAFEPARARAALEVLLARPEWGAAWLLESGGETAGYAVVTVGYSLEFGGRFGLLDELYVEDAWRGMSFGARAIAFAEEWCRARGLSALRLEVGFGNLRALGLYRRSGFEVHDRHFLTKRL